MKKKKVIFDCDNTMGIPGRDVDDGLTLIYLLGSEDIELLGVTLTHGNGTLEEVLESTEKLIRELDIKGLNVFCGEEGGRFLAEEAEKYKDELIVLATGAMTNLYTAYKYDNKFYKNLNELYLMGGIVEPLLINGKKVEELNFSVDPEAAFNVLSSDAKISILNGHTASKAIFGKKDIKKLSNKNGRIYRFLESSIFHWMENMKAKFGIDGFCNWDMAAAVFISHKELFEKNIARINPDIEKLRTGDLNLDDSGSREVIMPLGIKSIEKFNFIIFEAFEFFRKRYEK